MATLKDTILAAVGKPSYQPVKPKALARRLGVTDQQYPDFRKALRELADQQRVVMGKGHLVKPAGTHGTVAGIYRRTPSGLGFVRPHLIDGKGGPEIKIREADSLDAVTGDSVLVKVSKRPQSPGMPPVGKVVQILERSTRQFVGTYFVRDGQSYVRVDGTVFSHSVLVGDPGAKGAKPDDKVVFEMLRFPTPEDRGEGVITEVLGGRGDPGVDTLSVIRAFGLPDEFPEAVLEEARRVAAEFNESDLGDRRDCTNDLVVTIDPVDARDFDDAVALSRDADTGLWHLAVHIADVSHFAPPGSELDREARKRGTSVYLPQRVLPMFPELISNGLASLQQDRVRYVKSAFLDFTAAGQRTAATFAEAAIRNRRRFTYEEVSAVLADPEKARADGAATPDVIDLLLRMKELGMILRQRRLRRGALELTMPEAELEYDDQGRVSGAHFAVNDLSHQIIEEFMLAANEAVAGHLHGLEVPFLRRVHPAPDPKKLEGFAEFAYILGYKIDQVTDRFSLQRVLDQSADKPERFAVHYALLRSLKQAVYSPEQEGHYALASENYCHFTSPIRRYPDLTIHRLISRWLRKGKAGSDLTELTALGEHCSKTERRADLAERELVKVRLLTYMSERIGSELDAVITGVADYGFFAQAETMPVEGLVHVSTLTDDYYYYDETAHSLIGRKTKRRFRLGDAVRVSVVRVDLQRRQLDFRVAETRRAVDKGGRGGPG